MARIFKAPTKDGSNVRYDPRSLIEKIGDILKNKESLPYVALAVGITTVVFPSLLPFALIYMLSTWITVSVSRESLPMRFPIDEREQFDPNSPIPGTQREKFKKGTGTFLFGYEATTGEEVWGSPDDFLRHILLLGVTGAGKSEALFGVAANSLAMGAGVIYSDAKATIKLSWQIQSIASLYGAIDDFQVVNYITGGIGFNNRNELGLVERITHTAMPFSLGGASQILQTLMALMPAGGGGNEVFRERAIAIMGALLLAMAYLRNNYNLPISPKTIRQYLDMKEFVNIIQGKYGDLDEHSKTAIGEYLKKLPGWVEGKEIKDQPDSVSEQFGFAQMYWTRALGKLADDYDHIYADSHGEIDYADVVLNRRILCVLLPAMELTPDDLGALGKINLAALKGAMSIGLGAKMEGDKASVLDKLPSAEGAPTIAIFDEYGYQAAPGFAVAAAMARGLGVSCIFAGQGLSGFQALNPGEAGRIEVDQVVDNTRIKIAMALEDSEKTMRLFQSIGGQTEVLRGQGVEMDSTWGAVNRLQGSFERTDRIDNKDIRAQIVGEAHMVWMDKIIRFDFFHPNPTTDTQVRLSQGIALRAEKIDRRMLSLLFAPIVKPTSNDSDTELASVILRAQKEIGVRGLSGLEAGIFLEKTIRLKAIDVAPEEAQDKSDTDHQAQEAVMEISDHEHDDLESTLFNIDSAMDLSDISEHVFEQKDKHIPVGTFDDVDDDFLHDISEVIQTSDEIQRANTTHDQAEAISKAVNHACVALGDDGCNDIKYPQAKLEDIEKVSEIIGLDSGIIQASFDHVSEQEQRKQRTKEDNNHLDSLIDQIKVGRRKKK